jgi:hypothetical protein
MGRDAAKTDWQEIIAEMDISPGMEVCATQVKSDVADWTKRSPNLRLIRPALISFPSWSWLTATRNERTS